MITMQDIQSYLMWPGLCLFSGVAIYGFLSGIRSEMRKQATPKTPDLAQEFSSVERSWASEAKDVPAAEKATGGLASSVSGAIPMSLDEAIEEVTQEMLAGIRAGKLPEMIEEGVRIGKGISDGAEFAKALKEAIEESPDAQKMKEITQRELNAIHGIYGMPGYAPAVQVTVFQAHMENRFRDSEDLSADLNCLCVVCAMRRGGTQAVRTGNPMTMFAMNRDEVTRGSLVDLHEQGPDLKYPSVPVWMHRGRVLMSDEWPPQRH